MHMSGFHCFQKRLLAVGEQAQIMLIHISLNYLSSRLSFLLYIQNRPAAVFKLRATVKTILTCKQGLACHLKMANR